MSENLENEKVENNVEENEKEIFLNVKKLKCNFEVYKRERQAHKLALVEKCANCGKKFKDNDELYQGYVPNDETLYTICKKCATKE